ncbi:MAG: D-aminoacylase [Candidatus Latescibacteria bacterium]|nr:D-aminoacylase [Candidatus Latescibacterota bacterium]
MATFDVLITHGRIVDGTGAPWFRGDIGIVGDRIAAVGPLNGANAKRVIDAGEQIVCPGFIDTHVHSDAVLLADPYHEPAVRQGVTTEILGQDGTSYAPMSQKNMAFMREYFAAVNGNPVVDWNWQSVAEYLNRLDRRIAINVAYLVPHGALRLEAMGLETRPPTASELETMRRLLVKSLDEGAAGYSTGLDYIPCVYATTDELVELCKTVASYGGPYVTHIRYNRKGFDAAVEEALEIGERSGVGVHISHYKGKAEHILGLIDAGRTAGIDVTFDTYPYLAGSSILAMMSLPEWAQEGGIAATVARLKAADTRQRLRDRLETFPWERMHISTVTRPEHKGYEGLNPKQAADKAGKSVTDFVCDLLVAENMAVGVVQFPEPTYTEADLYRVMSHRAHMLGSDAIFIGGRPHPRAHGAFARYLGVYVREQKALDLEEAIRHITSAPARRFLLTDRGQVREGCAADLVVFDPEKVIDRATYEDSRRFAEGITHVFVNGQLAVENGQPTRALAGRALKAPWVK